MKMNVDAAHARDAAKLSKVQDLVQEAIKICGELETSKSVAMQLQGSLQRCIATASHVKRLYKTMG